MTKEQPQQMLQCARRMNDESQIVVCRFTPVNAEASFELRH
jgi:hypothetical protein